jgi:ketosteroid isomerase-like protein
MSQDQEILQTIADYGKFHDREEIDSLATLFTERMRYVSRGVVHAGRDNVTTFLADIYARRPEGEEMKHDYSNSEVDVVGDTAYVTSDFVAHQRMAESPWELNMVGRCIDRLVRRNGRWLFAERRVEPR